MALGVAALAVALALGFVLSRRPAKQETPAATVAQSPTGTVKFLMEQQWLIRMKLAQGEARVVARQIRSTGRVVPAAGHRVMVAPPVGGLLNGGELPRVGQQVARGETLGVIRQTPTAAEAAQVEASHAQLRMEQARLEAERRRLTEAANEARLRRDHAKLEFDRAQRLYDRKAYSERQLHAAEAQYGAADSNYAGVTAQLEVLNHAPAASHGSGNPPTTYAVQAPISGTVVKVSKEIGAQVAPGEVILEIVNLDTVWVEAPIFERDLAGLSMKTRAVFATPAHPGKEFTGRILNIGAVIDEQSRAATLLFEVPNQGRILKIGMQADVHLDAGETVEAVLIPKEAVLEHEGKKIVYVLLSGEEFQRREVIVGDEYGEKVAVLRGLKAGGRVVTQGAYQLRLQELRPATPGAHTHEM